jgi:hypothetical protein
MSMNIQIGTDCGLNISTMLIGSVLAGCKREAQGRRGRRDPHVALTASHEPRHARIRHPAGDCPSTQVLGALAQGTPSVVEG